MKIAYLLSHDITKDDGVTKKILGQTEEWKKQGHDIEIYCFLSNQGISILDTAKMYEFKSALGLRLKIQKKLLDDLNNFNPDIVYFRYDTWSRTLSIILNKYRVVTELNTYDLGEFWLLFKQDRTIKSFLRYLSYKFLRSKVLSRVYGIVAVTKEISEHSSNLKFNKPSIYIPNGINLEKYTTIKTVKDIDTRVGLFFIGTPNQPWHGVDIIEKISKMLPQYDFHIVGIEGESKNNLFWHGYLQKNEYLEILKKSHICIGTLALYRNDMQEACPLKVREYLAYGYPVILGYKDTALINKNLPDWVLEIDSQIMLDYGRIENFVENNKKIVVEHTEIDFIDTAVLEKERINFFERVMNR